MPRIPPVRFLSPHHQMPDLRRISNPQLLPQLRQHVLEPLRVAHGLHPHPHHLSLQPLIKLPRLSFLMLESPLPQLARLTIDHGDLLVARVKITSYNLHRGSFLPEPWFWQTQVYSVGSGAALRHTIKGDSKSPEESAFGLLLNRWVPHAPVLRVGCRARPVAPHSNPKLSPCSSGRACAVCRRDLGLSPSHAAPLLRRDDPA